jgi:exonuclease III
VLSACRQAARPVPVAELPWPERVLALELADGTEIVNVHSPISPKPGLAKLRTHRAVYEHLARPESRPRMLCGDLNTPRREHADGTAWTFARDRYGRLRTDRGEEWDEAELLLIRGLGEYGFSDAFRSVHGYERREISWGWQRWKGGYRLDHLLVSGLTVDDCRYEHRWREEGLSDHSPLISLLSRSVSGEPPIG